MADHYEAAVNYRAIAIIAADRLTELHDQPGDDRQTRRMIGHHYDKQRAAMKLAEIDAILFVGQGLRDVVTAIEARA